MPQDDWAKYARRDRGRRAVASGEFFRVDKSPTPKKRKSKARRKRPAGVTKGGYAITYDGPPRNSTHLLRRLWGLLTAVASVARLRVLNQTLANTMNKHHCSYGFFANSAFGKLNHITVTCNRWTCKCCRRQLINGWTAHFADCTQNLPQVYRQTVERRDWDSLYARLRRRGIRYIAVAVGYTRMAVYTDKPHGDCEHISAADAQVSFRRELDRYVHEPKKHPVSTCREWKRPKKPSKYTRIPDVPPVKAEHVRTAAEQLAIELKPWTSQEASGLEVLSKREDALQLILLSAKMAGASKRRKRSMKPESVVCGDRLIPTPTRSTRRKDSEWPYLVSRWSN